MLKITTALFVFWRFLGDVQYGTVTTIVTVCYFTLHTGFFFPQIKHSPFMAKLIEQIWFFFRVSSSSHAYVTLS
jgi:hypothetical protein